MIELQDVQSTYFPESIPLEASCVNPYPLSRQKLHTKLYNSTSPIKPQIAMALSLLGSLIFRIGTT